MADGWMVPFFNTSKWTPLGLYLKHSWLVLHCGVLVHGCETSGPGSPAPATQTHEDHF